MTEPAIFAICLIQYPTPLASSSNGFLYSRASAFGVVQDAIIDHINYLPIIEKLLSVLDCGGFTNCSASVNLHLIMVECHKLVCVES
jgi:hypothetical protein